MLDFNMELSIYNESNHTSAAPLICDKGPIYDIIVGFRVL
jgi:hypothetical protein